MKAVRKSITGQHRPETVIERLVNPGLFSYRTGCRFWVRVGVDQTCELVSEPMRILTMGTLIGWDRMDLIQSAGAELYAPA